MDVIQYIKHIQKYEYVLFLGVRTDPGKKARNTPRKTNSWNLKMDPNGRGNSRTSENVSLRLHVELQRGMHSKLQN